MFKDFFEKASSLQKTKQSQKKKDKKKLADDLYDFKISLEKQAYTLPAPFTEFEKNGWKLESKADEIVAAKNTALLLP